MQGPLYLDPLQRAGRGKEEELPRDPDLVAQVVAGAWVVAVEEEAPPGAAKARAAVREDGAPEAGAAAWAAEAAAGKVVLPLPVAPVALGRFQAQGPDLSVERAFVDSQLSGCGAAVAVRVGQGA